MRITLRRLILLTLALPTFLVAQDIPIEIEATEVLFCQPGVTNASPSRGLVLEYAIRPGVTMSRIGDFAGQEDVQARYWEDRVLKVKVPVVNRTDFKIILGMNHTEETYHFDPLDIAGDPFLESLNEQTLKSTRFTGYAVKSLNQRYYALARLEVGYNGDFDKFVRVDDQYEMFRAALLVGRKWSEDFEVGAGLLYTNTFRRTSVWPFVFANYTLSPKWGIEAVVPVDLKVRYDWTPKRLLLMGFDYFSREHSVDFRLANDADPTNVFLRRHFLGPTITIQQQVFSEWTWVDFQAGYTLDLNTRVRNDGETIDETINMGSAPYFRVSFFVSPPRKVICK